MPLTDIVAKNAKSADKKYKLTDEKGLFLLVHPNGSKYWQMKFRFSKKEKLLSFGTYPETSLKEARDKRDKARKQIQEGLDPSQEKKLEKLQRHISSENSFQSIATKWHSKQLERWTPRHAHYVLKRLEADIFRVCRKSHPEIHRNFFNFSELFSC